MNVIKNIRGFYTVLEVFKQLHKIAHGGRGLFFGGWFPRPGARALFSGFGYES